MLDARRALCFWTKAMALNEDMIVVLRLESHRKMTEYKNKRKTKLITNCLSNKQLVARSLKTLDDTTGSISQNNCQHKNLFGDEHWI